MEQPKSILVVPLRGLSDQYPSILAQARRQFGCRYTFIVANAAAKDMVSAWTQDGDEIDVYARLVSEVEARRPNPDAVFKEAAANEKKFGVSFMRDILLQSRDISGYYMQYAKNDVWSQVKPKDFVLLLDEINYYFSFFSALMERREIDCVLCRTSGIMDTVITHVALAKNIPVTFPLNARLGAYFIWSPNGYLGNELFAKEWAEQPEAEPLNDAELAPPLTTARKYDREKQMRSFSSLAKRIAQHTLNRVIWRTQDLKRRRWSRRLPYVSVVQKEISVWSNLRRLDSIVCNDMAELTRRPYILFLLQLEPEYTIQTMAKEFAHTFAVVRQIASCLPSDMRLIIKEHLSAVGNRDIGFYEDLLRLPNVIMAPPQMKGVDLARQAVAVSTISGTVGLEAGYLGKRALMFSDRPEFSFLPHIVHNRNLMDLPRDIAAAVKPVSDEEALRFRRNAAGFRAMLLKNSWICEQALEIGGPGGPPSEEHCQRAVDLLAENWRFQRQYQREHGLVPGWKPAWE